MQQRIIGFDLARAYAIFGMFIVNFNFSFGSIMAPTDSIGRFLSIFTGNSTAIFIICAGMGITLMSNRVNPIPEEKKALRLKILKRSWFLFVIGLLLYNWWQGDILHFYGGYMHFAAFLLFVPKRYFLWIALSVILIHTLLLSIIPIETAWDFKTFNYTDFWTPIGFLRNTFYNGWNSMFPWISYFLLGMWLGKLDWRNKKTKLNIFTIGFILFTTIQFIRFLVSLGYFNSFWNNYIISEYFPAYIPFLLVTMGFALMVIVTCMYIGERFWSSKWILLLQKTGQMTLTHYVFHLTFGMIILALLTKKEFSNGLLPIQEAIKPIYILLYSILFFIISVLFSLLWSKKFKNGPLETLMRKVSG